MSEHKRFRAFVIAAGAALCSCARVAPDGGTANSGCAEPVASGPVVEEIRALEEEGAAGNVTGRSLQEAEHMTWPVYLAVNPDGTVTTREMLLGQWSAAGWASRFDVKELDIKVYCDMAIVVGLSEALPLGADAATKPVHFRWLNVWTQANNEWRLSATQFTRFSDHARRRT